jgi:KTSC domain-containing protein
MPSTVIRTYEYCAASGELRVTFQSGKRYVYQGVPVETYTALKQAFSKGEFFNVNIRDHFAFVREEPRPESTMKETRDIAKPKRPAEPAPVPGPRSVTVPDTAPIKTPDPTDADASPAADEVPKVGSKDAPGG